MACHYNPAMPNESQHLPDPNRLSVLTASVLLAYALAQWVEQQSFSLELNLAGLLVELPLNLTATATLLAAGLTATGMDWLLRAHPRFVAINSWQHWLLPALTALVVGVPLYTFPTGPAWWLMFGLGGVLLLLVFIAEYIAVDATDLRYPAASAGLIALSYMLFFVLVTVLGITGARLIFIVPAVFLAAFLVGLRAINLRLYGRWEFAWAAGIGLVCVQVAAAMHYWPLLPIQYGLLVLGPLYALTGFSIGYQEQVPNPRLALEGGLGLAVFCIMGLLLSG